jgi:hypothetical protein
MDKTDDNAIIDDYYQVAEILNDKLDESSKTKSVKRVTIKQDSDKNKTSLVESTVNNKKFQTNNYSNKTSPKPK